MMAPAGCWLLLVVRANQTNAKHQAEWHGRSIDGSQSRCNGHNDKKLRGRVNDISMSILIDIRKKLSQADVISSNRM